MDYAVAAWQMNTSKLHNSEPSRRCGKAYDDNCTHYLSDALIKGGITALDGGQGADLRTKNGMCVCTEGRPIRAKELRAWFNTHGTKVSTQPSGICFMYQERKHDGQGHVLLKKGNGDVQGTGDYPNWEIQEYYLY